MPVDITAAGLSGDGTIDLTGHATFTDVIAHLVTAGPRVSQPTTDTELVVGVGYFTFGFALSSPFPAATFWVPEALWINGKHCWFDGTKYPWMNAGGWSTLRYHFSPGTVVDLWLSH